MRHSQMINMMKLLNLLIYVYYIYLTFSIVNQLQAQQIHTQLWCGLDFYLIVKTYENVTLNDTNLGKKVKKVQSFFNHFPLYLIRHKNLHDISTVGWKTSLFCRTRSRREKIAKMNIFANACKNFIQLLCHNL